MMERNGRRVALRMAVALVACLGLGLAGCRSDDGAHDESTPAATEYDAGTMAAISRIENGLLPRVRVEGEPGWTLGERMDRWNVEAVSVAVIDDFDIAWARAWGVADREEGKPATTGTLFQAGSISKPVAATGALRMVEEGMLDLDTPVNEYLTSWQLPDNEFTAQTPVTIRQLLSHTAGTTVHGFPGYAPWEPIPTIPQVLDGVPPANTAAVRVDIPPGSQVRYSGGGTTIVQLAMTDVSGEPFPELLHRLVLEPAGMTLSTYENPLPASRLYEAAAGYRQNGSAVPGKRHTYPEMQAAGLWTTPTDLARFAIAMQNSLREASGGVLQLETAREMITPVLETAGLGFFVDDEDGTIYFQHGGADEGFQALLIASRDAGYGVAVMANSDNGGVIAQEILRAVALEYGWDGILEEAVTSVELSAAELSDYEGRYRREQPPEVARVRVEGGDLKASITLRGFTSRLIPLGDDVFLFEEQGDRYRFVRDSDGAVVSIASVDRPNVPGLQRVEHEDLLPAELLEAGRIDEALEAVGAARMAEVQVNWLGYQLLNLGRNEQAVAVFVWNAERNPTHANPWDSLADGYLAVGDTASAVDAYRKVLEAIPLDTDADPATLSGLETRATSQLAALGGD
jgi:CubicO group peptidase (beta-lactamase class C family)